MNFTKKYLLSAVAPLEDYYQNCDKYGNKPSKYFVQLDDILGNALETLEYEQFLQQKKSLQHLKQNATGGNIELLADFFNSTFDTDSEAVNTLCVVYDAERQVFKMVKSYADDLELWKVSVFVSNWRSMLQLQQIKQLVGERFILQKELAYSLKVVKAYPKQKPSMSRLLKLQHYFDAPSMQDFEALEQIEAFTKQRLTNVKNSLAA